MWKSLCHPNVVPLLGVPKDRSQLKFVMISVWMPNGDIREFVRTNMDVNRFKLVRFLYRILLHSLLTQPLHDFCSWPTLLGGWFISMARELSMGTSRGCVFEIQGNVSPPHDIFPPE